MFSPNSLALTSSIKVSGLIAIPCLASLLLIVFAEIPLLFTLAFVLIHIFISYQSISLLGFLSKPSSISLIEVLNNKLYLQDQQGHRYTAELISKSFIFPSFSLLSFECEKIQKEPKSTAICLETSQLSQAILSPTDTLILDRSLVFKFFQEPYKLIRARILLKPRRHVFICRYNAANSSAYRRIRVWLKFS